MNTLVLRMAVAVAPLNFPLLAACGGASGAPAASGASSDTLVCTTSRECLANAEGAKIALEGCVKKSGEVGRSMWQCTLKVLSDMNVPVPNGRLSGADAEALQKRALAECSGDSYALQCATANTQLPKAYCECGAPVFGKIRGSKTELSADEMATFRKANRKQCGATVSNAQMRAQFVRENACYSAEGTDKICACTYDALRTKYNYPVDAFLEEDAVSENHVGAAVERCETAK